MKSKKNICQYFGRNGYPFDLVEKCIKTKFDFLFISRIPSTDVSLKKYTQLYEFSNREVKVELTKLIHRFIYVIILNENSTGIIIVKC